MRSTIWRLGSFLVAVAVVAAPLAQADFAEAMAKLKAGNYAEAALGFQQLVDENPEYADGHFLLGVCFMKTAKPADAEKAFKKAIQLNGDKFEYHYNLANAYKVRGNYSGVVNTLNAAEGLAPSTQKNLVYKLRGFAYAAQKKWGEAIVDLEQSVKIESDGTVLNQIGKAYFALGQEEESASAFRRGLSLKPDAEGHRLLAETLLNMAARSTSESTKRKHYSEALEEAEKLRKMKNTVEVDYLIGRAALGSKDWDRAVRSFETVLAKKPGHCNAMTNMAMALIAKKDWSNALVSAENATVCKPSLGIAWDNKGFILQKLGSEVERDSSAKISRYKEAIAAYERANSIKASSSIQSKIAACKENINVIEVNLAADEGERQQLEAERREQQRLKEEEEKRKKWADRDDD